MLIIILVLAFAVATIVIIVPGRQPAVIDPPQPLAWQRVDPLVREAIQARLDEVAQRRRSPDAWAALAKTYHANDLLELASPCYEQSIRLEENQPQTLYLYARLHADSGRLADAIHAIDRAIEKSPQESFLYWRRGWWQADVGRLDAARQSFESATRVQPQDAIGWVGLARVAALQGQHERAASMFEEVLRKLPTIENRSYIESLLAQSYRSMGLAEKAASMPAPRESAGINWADPWIDELKNFRRQPQWLLVQANNHLAIGDAPKALADLAPLIRTRPDDPEVLRLEGMAQLAAGNGELALPYLRRFHDAAPEDPTANSLLASAYEQQRNLEQAERCARRFWELSPTRIEAAMQYGSILFKRRQFDETAQVMHRALSADPEAAECWYLLAATLGEQGRPNDAREALKQAVRLAPDAAQRSSIELHLRQIEASHENSATP